MKTPLDGEAERETGVRMAALAVKRARRAIIGPNAGVRGGPIKGTDEDMTGAMNGITSVGFEKSHGYCSVARISALTVFNVRTRTIDFTMLDRILRLDTRTNRYC